MDSNFTIRTLNVIPMRSVVVFPKANTSFDVGRKASLLAVERAEALDHYVFLTRQKDPEQDDPAGSDLCTVGTVALIKQVTRAPAVQVRITVQGVYRARIRRIGEEEGSLVAEVEELLSEHGDPAVEEACFRMVKSTIRDLMLTGGNPPKNLDEAMALEIDPESYINITAQGMHFKSEDKQRLLEEPRLDVRLRLLAELLNGELEVARVSRKISQDVRKNIEKSQREYYLREQIKVIRGELGEDGSDGEKLREQLLQKGLPPAVEEKAMEELARMERMPPSSPEYTVLRNYADWLLALPWKEETKDTESLSDVEKVLEEDHYGLEKIKERVVEYLAVLKLTGQLKAPILCLVGPPGVGKTSIAKSIARALGRRFVRMSLGGLKDEAEIRGHRRTYIGAMPGRILYEMKNAGSVNPVFLLDEVDKISADLRGDPSSALLEVLDPEQNSTFRDRYLEVEYDLSKVMFIATANTLETIPAPLRDRMEIIELSGYTAQEKEEIARRYLVPKKRKENGVPEESLRITDGAIAEMIDGYTMEAGVRNLERTIGTVCRKAAVGIAKGEAEKYTVTKSNLGKFLGAKRFLRGGAPERDEVGAATGLAWTAVGGTTLTVEVSVMPGKGDVLLTGKLGDVMQESARAALSFIRAHAETYRIDRGEFEHNDLHIHVPEGATPKDGPSAGVTMATAILSAFTGRPVRKDVAMTGEITLRGKVLPIGGLKEKALAAARAGIRNVIIPAENGKDLEEIPANVRKTINFIEVTEADEVFRAALGEGA